MNATSGATLYHKQDLRNTVILVQTARTVLWSLQIVNNDASAVHVQLFNAAAAGDVTLGTTEPDMQFLVAAAAFHSASLPLGALFPKGLCIAATATASDNDDPGVHVDFYAQIV